MRLRENGMNVTRTLFSGGKKHVNKVVKCTITKVDAVDGCNKEHTTNYRTMPEGPELRLAANFINKVASQHLFSGKVIKSDLATKLTEVPFEVRFTG